MPVPARKARHVQGGEAPRAVFYFVHEPPGKATNMVELARLYYALAKSENPGRFRSFLAFAESGSKIPHAEKLSGQIPGLPGRVYTTPRAVVQGVLAKKLRHEAEHLRAPGTPSLRPPEYYKRELCVIFIGSLAYLFWHARLNLEETGVLRRKYLDFTIAAADLVPHSQALEERTLPSQVRGNSHLLVNCFDKEGFYAGNIDEFFLAMGIKARQPRRLTTDQVVDRFMRKAAHQLEDEVCS